LILEGKQGIGKSSLLRILFDPHEHGWFTDETADLGTKDSAMQLRGVWCVELAELDAQGQQYT
jgi:putative DNA primase/helicase